MNRRIFIQVLTFIISSIFGWRSIAKAKSTSKVIQYICFNIVDDYNQVVDLSEVKKVTISLKKLPDGKVFRYSAHIVNNKIISDKKIMFDAGLWEKDFEMLLENGSVFRAKRQFLVEIIK